MRTGTILLALLLIIQLAPYEFGKSLAKVVKGFSAEMVTEELK